MSFLLLLLTLSALAYVSQWFMGDRRDVRAALRHGMAGGFILIGIDHFVSARTRYVPMLPDALVDYALELVYLTGLAELVGAIGLLLPLAVYRRLGLPNLRQWAGAGLAVMLGFLVIANINVAVKGMQVQSLEFGTWYSWARPYLQPIFVLWALYVGELWPRAARGAGEVTHRVWSSPGDRGRRR